MFSEVSGSPFDTPGNGSVAAFDPSGRLLAVADGDGHVSMDTVAAGGVPTAVPGSPFAVGQSSASVAFDEQLTEVDGSPFASGEVRVGWRSARGIF